MAFLDGREEAIYDFAKKYYQNFFSKNNFEVFKKDIGKESASISYSDSKVVIRISYENKMFVIDFGQIQDTSYWNLDIIKGYFKITDYRIDEDDIINRKKILLESFNIDDYSGNTAFLINNFNKIKNIFALDSYTKTKIELEKLRLEKQSYLK